MVLELYIIFNPPPIFDNVVRVYLKLKLHHVVQNESFYCKKHNQIGSPLVLHNQKYLMYLKNKI